MPIGLLSWQGYIWIAGLVEMHGLDREAASRASVVTIVLVGTVALLSLAAR